MIDRRIDMFTRYFDRQYFSKRYFIFKKTKTTYINLVNADLTF